MYKRKRVDPRVIGTFVIGAILLGVGGLVFFGPGGLLTETEYYVLHFDGSVKGLTVGAPVRFRGVNIGQVSDINVRVSPADFDFRIPVVIEISPSRIESEGSDQNFMDAIKATLKGKKPIQALVEKGLRARLELDSLVTGRLYVNFDIFPDTPINLVGHDTEYTELPTTKSSLGEITEAFKELPLRKLAERLVSVSEGLEQLITSPSLHNGLAKFDQTMNQLNLLLTNLNHELLPSLDGTLADAQRAIRHLDDKIDPLSDDVRQVRQKFDTALEQFTQASAQTKATMQSWQGLAGNDSRIQQQLNQTLQEISKAARSVRYLTTELEHDPQLLLRGRVEGEKQ